MNSDPSKPETFLAEALEREIARHESGQFEALGCEYDTVEHEILPFQLGAEHTLGLALRFWDSWVDSSNHEWQYYPGIRKDDWPRLASVVITALRAHQLPNDPVVLASFGAQPPSRLRMFFRRLFGAT